MSGAEAPTGGQARKGRGEHPLWSFLELAVLWTFAELSRSSTRSRTTPSSSLRAALRAWT